jgi:hypothetical protein
MENKFQINEKLVPNQLMVLFILIIFYYFQFILKGTSINGNDEFHPVNSVVNTTVTKMIKTIENGSSYEPTITSAEVSQGETVTTTITKEEIVTETTIVAVESESSTIKTDESAPTEAITAPVTDGMDTSQ